MCLVCTRPWVQSPALTKTQKWKVCMCACMRVYTFPSETVSFSLCWLPTCCVVEDSLDLLILVPSSPQFCSSRHTALCPLYTLLGSDQGFVHAEQVLSKLIHSPSQKHKHMAESTLAAFYFISTVLGSKTRALCILGKNRTIELNPQPKAQVSTLTRIRV